MNPKEQNASQLRVHGPRAQDIDENNLERMAAIHGDSEWQPEWELLAGVVSVDLWRPLFETRAVALVHTDASAALGVARRLTGRTPAVNHLVAELDFRLQCMGCTLQDEHPRSTLNVEADALSRLTHVSFGHGRYPRFFVICVLHLT